MSDLTPYSEADRAADVTKQGLITTGLCTGRRAFRPLIRRMATADVT
jgi:hypothetical protein